MTGQAADACQKPHTEFMGEGVICWGFPFSGWHPRGFGNWTQTGHKNDLEMLLLSGPSFNDMSKSIL